nr:Wzz/FepE/Etk N-terminal domain-containing protein [Vibrio sinensis]
MDLRELFKALWDGKLIIIATTVVFAIAAVAYALTAQQWWSSSAKVTQPQIQDIAAYQQQVKQFQPVFDIYQEDGTVLVSEELDDLIDPEILFQRFIGEYNSSNSKRKFLDGSEEFQVFKSQLDQDAENAEDSSKALYAAWFQKITASAENRTANSPYNLNFQSTTKQSSFVLLSDYLDGIERTAKNDAFNNLQAVINSKQNELVQQKMILESQARNRLTVEAERTQYALAIAKAAGVNQPIQTNANNELFAIDMGSKALEAKVKALESVKNLSVIEPRLQQIDAKLDMLNTLKINRDVEFQTFRFIENVEPPISRDKPKRALIAVLGTLLGGMLGVAIVLVRFAFRKED